MNNFLATKESNPQNKELGFWWGNFWIGTSIIFGILFLVIAFIGAEDDAGIIKDEGSFFQNRIYIVFESTIGIISAIGLLMRKKMMGLYVVYFILGLDTILGLFSLLSLKQEKLFEGIVIIIICAAFFRYFYRRTAMFT